MFSYIHYLLKQIKINDIFIFIFIFGFEDYIYLLPSDQYFYSSFKYSDIVVFLSIIWSVPIIFNNIFFYKKKCIFLFPFVLAVFSVYFSSICAYIYLGQPLIQSILPFRKLFAVALFCFAILCQLKRHALKISHLITILYIIAILELFIYTCQGLLAQYITFTYLETDETRFGLTRLRVPFLLPVLMGIFSFSVFLNSKKRKIANKIFHIFISIWSILLVAFICQHRAPTLILIASYCFMILFWKGAYNKKIFIFCIAFIIVCMFSTTPLFQAAIKTFTGQDTQASTNTLSLRNNAQSYYLSKLEISPIFGFGKPNQNYSYATQFAGEGYHYYLVDNGIFGFAFQLGLFGLLWLFIVYFLAFRYAAKIYVYNHNFAFIHYIIFEIANLYIGMHWFNYYPFPFMIALTLIDYHVTKELK